MSSNSGDAPVRRGPGEWMIPDRALAASRMPPPPVRPIEPSDIDADGLAALLELPGPVLVIDGEAARTAWDAIDAFASINTNSATSTGMLVNAIRNGGGDRKPLLLDSTAGGLPPETLLGNDMSTMRVGILANPGTELSDGAAAKCRIVRILPSPQPAPR